MLPQCGFHVVANDGAGAGFWPTRFDIASHTGANGVAKGASKGQPRRNRSMSPEGRRRNIGRLSVDLAILESRDDAVQSLMNDVYAPSMRRVAEGKLRTIAKALPFWGHSLLPPSVDTIRSMGAALKCG